MNTKRSFSLLKSIQQFVLILVFAVMLIFLSIDVQASEPIASGSCGKNLTFVLDSDGVLTISGKGKMDDNDFLGFSPPAWVKHRESITKVVIEEGVTSIGNCAFRNCENITEVSLPDTLTSIGEGAFGFCEKITSIHIPASVKYIGKSAFEWNSPLKDVYITDLDAWLDIEFESGNNNDPSSNPLYWADNLYLNGELVTEVVVPEDVTALENCVLSIASLEKVILHEGITKIGQYAFNRAGSLKEIVLPDTVTSIGKAAFSSCTKLEKINIPYGVTSIERSAFSYCSALNEIVIPDSVTYIGPGAFWGCNNLTEVAIPDGVTKLEKNVLFSCGKLASVTISDTLTSIEKDVFGGCNNLNDVYYYGSEASFQELKKNTDQSNTYFLNANVHIKDQPFVVLSDIPSMNIEIGDTITLSAGIHMDENKFGNASSVTFQLANGSNLDVVDSGTEDGLFFAKFKGTYEGTTYVTFHDSVSGQKATVVVTVSENNYFTYNIADVPEKHIEDFPTNFYNFNGLYIDNYKYKVNIYEDPMTGIKENMGAHVTFDVYNANYMYAIVEIYKSNGELFNAVLIDKRKDYNTSIYGVLGEGTAATVKGVCTGDLFNYRGEHNSTRTSVELDIPSNGYIKITSDPCESDILAVVNSVDLLMTIKSLTGELNNYDPFDSEFADAFTKKLLADTTFANLKKDGAKVFENLFVDMGKELVITPKAVGDFAATLSKQLTELNLMDAVKDSLLASGISMGENIFIEMFGLAGKAMETVFMIGKVSTVALAYNDFALSEGSGAVRISNQGGGLRSAMGVRVMVNETDDTFASDVALQTYKVELDEDLLTLVKNADQESYELLTSGISHTYDISLMQNGKNIQHNGSVMVYIPIPEDIRSLPISGNVKVYRIEENGGLTDMDAAVEDNSIVFTTEHFSLYTVVGYEDKKTDNHSADDNPAHDNDDSDDDTYQDTDDTSKGGMLFITVIVIVVLLLAVCGVIAVFVLRKKIKKE